MKSECKDTNLKRKYLLGQIYDFNSSNPLTKNIANVISITFMKVFPVNQSISNNTTLIITVL